MVVYIIWMTIENVFYNYNLLPVVVRSKQRSKRKGYFEESNM